MCERLGSSAGPLAAFGAALLFAAFAILSLGPSPASAAKPCWELVLDDWADNASIERPTRSPASSKRSTARPRTSGPTATSRIRSGRRCGTPSSGGRRAARATPKGRSSRHSAWTRTTPLDPIPLLVLAACASALIIAGGAGIAVRKLRR